MSYFNDKFNAKIELFEIGNTYREQTVVKYNGFLYMAKKDTREVPEEKTTNDDWEYISPDSVSKIFANLGCADNGYPVSLGTQDNPFYAVNAMNSINLVTKNKTVVPGFMGTLRFGRDMSDGGTSVNVNVLYDSDYDNPAFIAATEKKNEVSLGNGIYRYRDVYTTSNPITLSDKKYISNYKIMDGRYIDLLDRLEPVEYQLHTDYSGSGRKHIGFLAEDVETLMEGLGIGSENFAGLVKYPVYKKDIYKDFEINEYSFLHYHYEMGEEVCDTEENYKQNLTGKNRIRYCQLPIYKKELGYIYFKNYPKGSLGYTGASDIMDISVRSIELVPYEGENVSLDFSKLVLTDDYTYENQVSHEITEDGILHIHFDDDAEYKYLRMSLTEDETPLDCSKYKYIKIISDFDQPYLLGFSDTESAKAIDEGVDYFTSEYGDMYSYAQDKQYEIATYIYGFRYEELIPVLAGKIKQQDNLIKNLENRITEIEKTRNNN